MTRTSWKLSAEQFDVLGDYLGVEGFPAPLLASRRAGTTDERTAVLGRVAAEFAAAGLLRRNQLDADLEAALRTLARPAIWVYSAWIDEPGADEPVRVVGAAVGHAAVCAVQHPDDPGAVVIETIPAARMSATVAQCLPPSVPGGRGPLTIASPTQGTPTTHMRSASGPRPGADRAAATAILHAAHDRAGEIVVNSEIDGRRVRGDVLRWCDVPGDGRYLTWSEPDGTARLVPADDATVTEAIRIRIARCRPR